MFAQGTSSLTRLTPDAVPVPRASGARAARVDSDAARALRADPGWMTLSERLRDPEGWRRIQRRRRSALEALLAAEPTRETVARAADLLAAIAEELSWAESAAPFDDDAHPEIDFACAETCALLGWTRRVFGDALGEFSPNLPGKLLYEVRRRALTPLMAHDDYPFLTGGGARPLSVCADLLLAALFLETDDARRGRVVKKLLRALDECCAQHGRRLDPLADRVTDVAAASDLASLLARATRGELDLTDRLPMPDWLDEILFAWIQDDRFVDPGAEGMVPPLSGGDVFRVGLYAGDGALTALGAQLFRHNRLPAASVTGRMLEAADCAMLEAESGRPPRLRYAATARNLVMSARMPGLYCALHVGGGRSNAGDCLLFSDGQPILTEAGADCAARNLPTLNGQPQLAAPDPACIADFEARSDREILSVDLTGAYPKACGLRAYQRTLLTLRSEQTIRLVDALTLEPAAEVAFSFVTPERPAADGDFLRLGPVRMSWEGALSPELRALGGGLTQILLRPTQPVSQGLFTFDFEIL